MLELVLGHAHADVLSSLSNLSGRGQIEERALLTVASVSDEAISLVIDEQKTEAVVNQLMVVYNEASNVAMRCCVLSSLVTLAIASISFQDTTPSWVDELFALLQSTVTSSSHRHMKQSIVTSDALNATATLALAELKQADPNLGKAQSTPASLRTLRSSVSAPTSKSQSPSLAAVRAASEVDSAMQVLHGGSIYQVSPRCVASENIGEKRLLLVGPQGVENPVERDRLISSRDTLREAATLSALLPRGMLTSLARSLAVVWNYDQIGIDALVGNISKTTGATFAPRSGLHGTVSSSAAVRYCREFVEMAKSLTQQPASFMPAQTAAEAQGLIASLNGSGKEYAFLSGTEGLGVYLQAAGGGSKGQLDTMQSLADLPLLSGDERAITVLVHGDQFRRIHAASYGAHLRYDTPFVFVQRLKIAVRSQQVQQVFAILRTIRDKGWHASTVRSTLALLLADLAVSERPCVQQVASLLCNYSPELVRQTLSATFHRQRASRQIASRRNRSGSSAASTGKRSGATSGVLMVPDFHREATCDEHDVGSHPHNTLLDPHAALLWHFCSTLLVNGTPSQVVNFFPVLVQAFDCLVPNKLLLLEHLMARIPELDNTWQVGNWLLSCVRNLLVSEVKTLEQHETLGLSSSTHAFLNAMMAHFSDCAISQHCAIIQNLLSHVPLCTTASLLAVSEDDAEDVLAMCQQRKDTAVTLPVAGTVLVFRSKPNSPKAISSLETGTLELTVTVKRATDAPVLAGTIELYADEERHHLVTAYPIAGLSDDLPSYTFSTHIEVHDTNEYSFFATFRGPLAAQNISEPLWIRFGDMLRLPATIAASSSLASPHVSLRTMSMQKLLERMDSTALKCSSGTLLRLTAVPNTIIEILVVEPDDEEGEFVFHFRSATWPCLKLFEEWIASDEDRR